MKYTEDTLGAKLFIRLGGRFVPAPEARAVFTQINEVHRNIENLKFAVDGPEASSSRPTVFTKNPRAQKCWPTKLRLRSP